MPELFVWYRFLLNEVLSLNAQECATVIYALCNNVCSSMKS